MSFCFRKSMWRMGKPVAIGAAVFGALFCFALPARAAMFDTVGDKFSGDFNGIIEGAVTPGLTANVVYELLGIDGDKTGGTAIGKEWQFKVTVSNTSSVDAARVSGLGFNSSPDVQSLRIDDTFGDDTFDNYLFNGNVPQLGTRELCFFDKPGKVGEVKGNGCGGGADGGVLNTVGDNVGMFVATLIFGESISSLELSDLYVRYQSITDAVLNLNGASGVGELSAVPLPAAGWLFLTGLVGLFGWQRQQKRARTEA